MNEEQATKDLIGATDEIIGDTITKLRMLLVTGIINRDTATVLIDPLINLHAEVRDYKAMYPINGRAEPPLTPSEKDEFITTINSHLVMIMIVCVFAMSLAR